MQIETQIHTLFLFVGPAHCGKSTFAQQRLIPALRFEGKRVGLPYSINVQYVSSDAIRQQLLDIEGDSVTGFRNKHDGRIGEINDAAFDLLYKRLEVAMRYPVKAEFIVLDSTGLSSEMRDRVTELCKRHQYHVDVVLFDYKQRADFFALPGSDKTVIGSQVQRMREQVLSDLSGKRYTRKTVIRRLADLSAEWTVFITDLDLYKRCQLPPDLDYLIVGDVHECLDELFQLVRSVGFEIDEKTYEIRPGTTGGRLRIVQVGDMIDKGGRTQETIEFMFVNARATLPLIYFVEGNHERQVYDMLTSSDHGSIGPSVNINMEHFGSYEVLRKNETLRRQFVELVEHDLLPVAWFRKVSSGRGTRSFYVTHAPCATPFVGKLDAFSRRRQRYTYCGSFTDTDSTPSSQDVKESSVTPKVEPVLLARILEGERNQPHWPYHFVGHVSLQRVRSQNINYDTKSSCYWFLDTDCVSGSLLSGVLVGAHYDKPKTVSTSSLSKPVDETKRFSKVLENKTFKTVNSKEIAPSVPSLSGDSAILDWQDDPSRTVDRQYRPDRREAQQLIRHLQPDASKDRKQSIEDTLTKPKPKESSGSALVRERLDAVIANHINFISGTVCPAPSNPRTGELESFAEAIRFYAAQLARAGRLFSNELKDKDKASVKLSIQPKYMGSRAQAYLYLQDADDSRSFCVSRNGFKIAQVPHASLVAGVFAPLRKRLAALEKMVHPRKIVKIVTDGELEPWSALGRDLIDRQFRIIGDSVQSEVDMLRAAGFDDVYAATLKLHGVQVPSERVDKKERKTRAKVETKERVKPEALESDKKVVQEVKESKKHSGGSANKDKELSQQLLRQDVKWHQPLTEHKKAVDAYGKQLDLFAGSRLDTRDESSGLVRVWYKPFSILKYVLDDGTQVIPPSQIDAFQLVSEDHQYIVDFDKYHTGQTAEMSEPTDSTGSYTLTKRTESNGSLKLTGSGPTDAVQQITQVVPKDSNLASLDLETCIRDAYAFYTSLTQEMQLEGVVIKTDVYVPGVVPFLKVRNPEYLRIIYGYDYRFPRKHAKLVANKSIKRKMQTSIREYDLGRELLHIPDTDMNHSNVRLTHTVTNLVEEEERETEIDPRL